MRKTFPNQYFRILPIFISLHLWAGAATALADENREELLTRSRLKEAVVEKILSADTLKLDSGEIVRLIGIKAPPPPARKVRERDEQGFFIEAADPVTPIEEQAFLFAQNLLEGQKVRLEYDTKTTDDDSHTLAYVFLSRDDLFANAELLRQGYVALHIRLPNIKHAELLRAAYREARDEKRGLQGD